MFCPLKARRRLKFMVFVTLTMQLPFIFYPMLKKLNFQIFTYTKLPGRSFLDVPAIISLAKDVLVVLSGEFASVRGPCTLGNGSGPGFNLAAEFVLDVE